MQFSELALFPATDAGTIALNTQMLQNALNIAANSVDDGVSIDNPGTYFINQIVMPSFANLYLGPGVTLKKPANTSACMFINSGALQGSPTSNTDIGFYGLGAIDGNVANQSGLTTATNAVQVTNTFLFGIQGEIAMINVNNFVFELRYANNCNGFFCQLIGNNARFSNIIANTARDFIHINGPSTHITIENCTGFSSDAFVALNAWDWHRSGPTVGDISDVRINHCAYYGSNGVGGANRTNSLLVLLPGTRTTGNGQGTGNVRNVTLDGFKVDMTQGSVTPASAALAVQQTIDSINGAEWSGAGTVSCVELRNGYATVPNSNCSLFSFYSSGLTADGQCTTTVQDVKLDTVHADANGASTGSNMISNSSTFTGWLVDDFAIKDCQWTPNNGATNQSFLNWATKTPADSIVFDGLQINSNTGSATISPVLVNTYTAGTASVINDLTLDRIRTAPGYQHASAWLNMNGGIINTLRSRGCYIVGSGAGGDSQGIFLNGATSQIGYAIIQDGYFNGTKELLMVSSAVSAAITMVVRGCNINNSTHPVFLNAAVTADVTFDGCSINSGSNIARLGSATGTLILSYINTVSSGAGATTITAAAAGVVRIRNSDRIQLPAAVTATNPPTPQNNDIINFAGTPSYTGSVVISGTLAGLYTFRGTGTTGWVKLN